MKRTAAKPPSATSASTANTAKTPRLTPSSAAASPSAADSPPPEDSDAILARILTLDGQEPGNANTLARYIYIHGTAHTRLLGRPASHGCIRMAPDAIIELYPLLPIGTGVFISQD